jgi:uncharacterized protein (UPF0216 family)
MVDELPYERMLQESLRDELRLLNANLPLNQKSLAELLGEEYPHVVCYDGSTHLFKREELRYLVSLLEADEPESFLLPVLIEVSSGDGEMAVICQGKVEEKIISKILDMPVVPKQARIIIYKRQLSVLRRRLKTATQYVFTPKITE